MNPDLISRSALLADISAHYTEYWDSFSKTFSRVTDFPAAEEASDGALGTVSHQKENMDARL